MKGWRLRRGWREGPALVRVGMQSGQGQQLVRYAWRTARNFMFPQRVRMCISLQDAARILTCRFAGALFCDVLDARLIMFTGRSTMNMPTRHSGKR